MSEPIRGFLAVALASGVVLGAGTVIALDATVFKPAPRVVPEPVAAPPPVDPNDDDALEAANANLTASLAECNRRLREAGQKPLPAPAAAPVASAGVEEGGGRRRRGEGRRTGPLTKEDWERHAEAGTVPYRIPCIRDTPYTPTDRDIERLGLAPDDAEAIRAAYEASNKRVTEQITPLCASVVGGAEIAQKIGPTACMKAIQDSSRRADPAKLKESLVAVAEVNAGKRESPTGDRPPAEKLMLALTGESKAFEADLAARLGPEDAARVANARGLCQERGVASSDEGTTVRVGDGRGGGRRGGE
jgi:hypothetical protein